MGLICRCLNPDNSALLANTKQTESIPVEPLSLRFIALNSNQLFYSLNTGNKNVAKLVNEQTCVY